MATRSTASSRLLIVDDDRALRHAMAVMLGEDGYQVVQVADGRNALDELGRSPFELMLLDVGLPDMNGLDLLTQAQNLPEPPRVVMITADDTPETLLKAIRGHADRYVTKPFAPNEIVQVVREVLASPPAAALPITVLSARPEWVELLVPCSLRAADRVHGFMMHLRADLPESMRDSVGQAFRELLCNAVEWGGKLDPSRMVRISCLRARRMVLYRIADPGEGFGLEHLTHAAISNPADDPLRHALVREEKGLRPGGLGLAITRELVDELIFNEARNEVLFVKYLD